MDDEGACNASVAFATGLLRISIKRQYLANLNTLRAFAVLAVLIDHIATLLGTRGIIPNSPFWSDFGGSGVMAFFVHTSLVLMLSMDRIPEYRKTLVFYVRRAFRIYPLSILCVLLVVLFKVPADPMTTGVFQSPSPVVLAANVLLVQNLIGRLSVTTPLWSLPFEVEMYVVLPILHKLAQSKRAVSYLTALLLFFSLLGWVVLKRTAHLNILGYVPCFISGVMAYALRNRRHFIPSVLWPIFVILWMILGTNATVAHPVYAYPIIWINTLLLGVAIYYFNDSTNRLWNASTEFVAKYSYGIYLAHVPVMWVVFWVVPTSSVFANILIWLIGTMIAAVGAYHLLEEPMINFGRKVSSKLVPSRISTQTNVATKLN